MEQDAGEMIAEAQDGCHRNMNVSPPAYRSITCQTEEFIPDISSDNCTYFFCNMNDHGGINTAAVQVNIYVKKTVDKMCEASMPSMKKNVQDSSCDPINFESVQSHCKGFHGFSSITSNETMSSLTGVTLSIFLWLLNKLPESKRSDIDKKTKLLITLMKLKTGLTSTAISVLFNIHRTTVSKIFVKNLQQLNILLKNFIFWPSKAAVQATSPESFKLHYPDTRVIIDCTAVNTEVPPAVKHRVLMYSDYKHHHTMKFLVGCTPSGFISFLSKCYGGRAGDCFITNDCGLIDLIEPGDVVLADKGFPQIQTKVQEKNAILVMPPFCNKNQFTPEEVDETYNIASVRIHIERVNQRIKDFNILSKVPVSLLPHVDEIVFVICAIINIQKPLFKQEKSATE
ncbi:uncharacterized protein LOC123266026 [Cotesia glomerata]|uniref:uncharacterized protein LOC123266026 n=1 Tax=Cotesia glomerata TaxID=32391 RepID=UPI001D028E11|nr:uncharacterized protein LOC123266026 [Cotesia glomerata]